MTGVTMAQMIACMKLEIKKQYAHPHLLRQVRVLEAVLDTLRNIEECEKEPDNPRHISDCAVYRTPPGGCDCGIDAPA